MTLFEHLAELRRRILIALLALAAGAVVGFFLYHGDNDGDHLDMFEDAMRLAVRDERTGEDIARHARIVARLYRLQLEEIDNV